MAIGLRAERLALLRVHGAEAIHADQHVRGRRGDPRRPGPLRLGHRSYPSAHLAAQELLGRAAGLRDVPAEERAGVAYRMQRRDLECALVGLRGLLVDVWGEVGAVRRDV